MAKTSGRPKKLADDVLTELLQLRIAPDEKQAFREAAAIAGVPLSIWVRERLRRMCVRELEDAGRVAAFLRFDMNEWAENG